MQLGGTVCFKSQLSMSKYQGMASQKQAGYWNLHSPMSTLVKLLNICFDSVLLVTLNLERLRGLEVVDSRTFVKTTTPINSSQ